MAVIGDGSSDCASMSPATNDDYVVCLEANTNCIESTNADCTNDYNDAVAACPQLPDGVRQSFVACEIEPNSDVSARPAC